jgi:hypothetical protein
VILVSRTKLRFSTAALSRSLHMPPPPPKLSLHLYPLALADSPSRRRPPHLPPQDRRCRCPRQAARLQEATRRPPRPPLRLVDRCPAKRRPGPREDWCARGSPGRWQEDLPGRHVSDAWRPIPFMNRDLVVRSRVATYPVPSDVVVRMSPVLTLGPGATLTVSPPPFSRPSARRPRRRRRKRTRRRRRPTRSRCAGASTTSLLQADFLGHGLFVHIAR